MSQDILRLIDGICREKNIDREAFIEDLKNALEAALRKKYEEAEIVEIGFDMIAGQLSATIDGEAIDPAHLGRIAAQVAKQTIIQKTRERERTSIFEEFLERQGTVVTGTVARAEGPALIVNVGRTEGFLPRSEQIPGETHQPGDRIRTMILEVREMPHQVRVVLSRSHPDFIARLFELEVPEIAERIIQIKALAREAGYRTKVAVSSIDSKVDAVGACVGVRGSRIKNIVDELGGEKIDIVRWNESSQVLIQNSLKPAEIQEIALCFELGRATVVCAEDQLSLAIGKRGQNVRLAARLTQWDIDIVTPADYNKKLEIMEHALKRVEGVDDVLIDKLIAIGCISVDDIDKIDKEPIISELEVDPELAEKIVYEAGEESIRQEELREAEAKAKAKAEREAAGITDEPPAPEGEATNGDGADAQAAETTSQFDSEEAASPASVAEDVAVAEPPAAEVGDSGPATELPEEPAASSEPDESSPAETASIGESVATDAAGGDPPAAAEDSDTATG